MAEPNKEKPSKPEAPFHPEYSKPQQKQTDIQEVIREKITAAQRREKEAGL